MASLTAYIPFIISNCFQEVPFRLPRYLTGGEVSQYQLFWSVRYFRECKIIIIDFQITIYYKLLVKVSIHFKIIAHTGKFNRKIKQEMISLFDSIFYITCNKIFLYYYTIIHLYFPIQYIRQDLHKHCKRYISLIKNLYYNIMHK